MRSTTAREASTPHQAGDPDDFARWAATWFSVSTTKPRLAASLTFGGNRANGKGACEPQRIAAGMGGRPALAGARVSRPGGPSLRGRRASRCSRNSASLVAMAWACIERLRTDFAHMIDAHQGARQGGAAPQSDQLRRSQKRVSARRQEDRQTGCEGLRRAAVEIDPWLIAKARLDVHRCQ